MNQTLNHTLIDTNAALQTLVARLGHSAAVAVDTEFMRTDTYFPRIGLVQLCFDAEPDTAWLLDPLGIDNFGSLRQLFADPAVVKVLHAPSEDLNVFGQFLQQQPLPLFDTQRAAAFVNLGFGLSYLALVQAVTGRELEKGETRSDWLARPLRSSQLDYAAQDVLPLLQVYHQLHARLHGDDKLDWVLEEGASAVQGAGAQEAAFHKRFRFAHKLSREQLAVLGAVCHWREERARALDRPRGWVLKDAVCMELARRQPATVRALQDIDGMPPRLARNQGKQIVRVIESARADPARWPDPLPPPLSGAQRERLKALKKSAAGIAAELGVAPEALLPAKDYELLVRLEGGEPIAPPPHWDGWRRQRVLRPLGVVEGVADGDD